MIGEDHPIDEEFDIYIGNNNVFSNDLGIEVIGDCILNISYNSIGHNINDGILFNSTNDNIVHQNDIYQNGFGMRVIRGGAYVDAERNYWGDSSGPYHESINTEGKGNEVNGDGTNLDFIPFTGSSYKIPNERPVAKINSDLSYSTINENITFYGGESTDDERVDSYYFDFGDNTASSWTPTSSVVHKYSLKGTYEVSLRVMDDRGILSNNTAMLIISIGESGNHKAIVILKSPNDKLITSSQIIKLQWTGEDNDADSITYDVYLDTNNEATILVSEGQSEDSFITGLLKEGSYYWRVIPNDGKEDGVCASGVWSFIIDLSAPNPKPIAHIDSILPNPANTRESISFSGHGTDDGTIEVYSWRSSKDGEISDQASFSLSLLSAGTHTIYFKVQDDYGDWSDEVSSTLEVKKKDDGDDDSEIISGFELSIVFVAIVASMLSIRKRIN